MTAATVTTRLEVNNPTEEVVILSVTDGQTYTSKKFSSVLGGQATIYEDSGSLSIPIGLGVSGSTVTIYGTGLSTTAVCLTLYGRK